MPCLCKCSCAGRDTSVAILKSTSSWHQAQLSAYMNWKDSALELLERSLKPVPQELNELDWKSALSTQSEKLAHHISAFANNCGGGLFAFGIKNDDASFLSSLYPSKKISEMTKDEKVQACYYHACLQHEKGEKISNQSVRARFNLGNGQSSMASRIIADTMAAGYIKPAGAALSKKFATYIPYYA